MNGLSNNRAEVPSAKTEEAMELTSSNCRRRLLSAFWLLSLLLSLLLPSRRLRHLKLEETDEGEEADRC